MDKRVDSLRRPRGAAWRAWRQAAAAAAGLALASCATGGALQKGVQAERQQDWDRAVVEYTAAVRAHPADQDARLALERVKLRATRQHVTNGRRLASMGKVEEALVEYQIASQLSPASTEIEDALRSLRAAIRAKVSVAHDGKTELQTLVERTRDLPPPGLDLPSDARIPDSLTFREAGSRDVFTALARFAGVSVVFDPAFRDAPLTIDLRKATFEQALQSVAASTRSFYRLTAPRTLTIVPDTPAKRREYEEEVVRTFYLSNADLKETIDLLRIVVDARKISSVAGTNAIALKDTPERVAAAAKLIAAIDKARPEVVIDVEVMEVDRVRLQEYGIQVATTGSTGVEGGAAVARDSLTLRDLRTLTTGDIALSSFPSLFYRLLRADSSTRTLANPQLRALEGTAAQARFGERVPVPNTTFSPIATGGVNTQPITSYTYENIGVNIDITPRTHHNDEVSLALKVEVSSISGTGYADLPTFGSRSVNSVIRLRDGETSILAGLIRDDERRTLEAVPGLSDLPLIGRLFARNRSERTETDIVITLTPHIVRVLDITENDLRPFRVGRDTGSPILDLLEPLRDEPAEPTAKPGTPPVIKD
ncbi:MAG TPA: type II and III secretion system protein [Vicinamibacterales bacterium]|nr:type II and III secretion system protein [Vicinamibacterales bacterium]HPW20884.1 type II and III secretion system protein [Vicinamibacterales bacterium]